jgi:hypothetical protein
VRVAERAAEPTQRLEAYEALGQTLFHMGEYVAARTHLAAGITLIDPTTPRAQALAHPSTRAVIRHWAAMLHQGRDAPAVQGFPFLVALGSCWQGWAPTLQGQREAGLAQLRQGLEAMVTLR